MGELKPKGGHGSGGGKLHLIRHTPGKVTRGRLRQEVVSFMPKTTGIEKRQDVKKALNAYLEKAEEFVSGALKTMQEDPLWAEDLPVSIALELYVMDKLKQCYDVVTQSANPILMNEFVCMVSTASFNSRMVFLSDQAKRNFENIAPNLNALCEKCGVQHLGQDAEAVVSAYLPEVSKMMEQQK